MARPTTERSTTQPARLPREDAHHHPQKTALVEGTGICSRGRIAIAGVAVCARRWAVQLGKSLNVLQSEMQEGTEDRVEDAKRTRQYPSARKRLHADSETATPPFRREGNVKDRGLVSIV